MLTSIALTYVGLDAHKDSINVALLRPGAATVDVERNEAGPSEVP